MSTTETTTPEIALRASESLSRSASRILHLLSFVPDDKLTWKPSPTAKSAINIVVHCAMTNEFFAMIVADTFPTELPPPEVMFAKLRDDEEAITSRETAIAMMEKSTESLKSALCAVDSNALDAIRTTPVGAMPLHFWIDVSGNHVADHAGQLAYVQTIWGDLDNHFN